MRQQLLDNIIRNPDDDTLRLVYADWLEEFGDANDVVHAQLIRCQIALTNCKKNYTDSNSILQQKVPAGMYADILMKQYLLQNKSEIKLIQGLCFPLFKLDETPPVVTWRRGFIEEISVPTMDQFIACINNENWLKGFKEHPIQRVNLKDRDSTNNGLASIGWMDFDELSDPPINFRADVIRSCLFSLLKVKYEKELHRYDTTKLADQDLSNACILLARNKIKKVESTRKKKSS